jgi:hypothetical protein
MAGVALVKLRRLLEEERATPADARGSRASDEQLDTALAEVTAAEESGGTPAAEADRLAQLAHIVSDSWPFSAVGAEVLGHIQALRRAADRG